MWRFSQMKKCLGFRGATAGGLCLLAATLGMARLASAEVAPEAEAPPPGELSRPVPIRLLLTDTARLRAWIEARHPDMGAAAARVEQAEAALSQSRVYPNPVLGLGVGGLTIGARNPSSLSYGDTLNWSVGLSETIELGKRGPRASAARYHRDAARESARGALADRLADARDALARLVYLNDRQHILEERLTSAKNVAALERVRLEHGDISGIDHDRLELDVTAVVQQFADNLAELEGARADCAALMIGSCSPIDATMDTVDEAVPAGESYPELERMIRNRPDIREARLESSAARTEALLHRRQAIPDPTVGVTYTHDYLVAAGNQPNTLQATVTMPLPVLDHGQHLARQSEGVATELDFSARSLETRASAEARALLLRRNVLREKLDTLTKFAIPRANGVLKSSDEAYHRGQLSLTDLLLVRREHASLLLDAIDTRYELFTVRNTLHRTLGIGATDVPTFPTRR